MPRLRWVCARRSACVPAPASWLASRPPARAGFARGWGWALRSAAAPRLGRAPGSPAAPPAPRARPRPGARSPVPGSPGDCSAQARSPQSLAPERETLAAHASGHLRAELLRSLRSGPDICSDWKKNQISTDVTNLYQLSRSKSFRLPICFYFYLLLFCFLSISNWSQLCN